MDGETQTPIFQPVLATTAMGTDAGLGLSVVGGMVAAHGGRVAVSCKSDRVTRFDAFLPTVPAGKAPSSRATA